MTTRRPHTPFRRLFVVGVLIMVVGIGVLGASVAHTSAQQDRSSQVIASLLADLDAAIPDDGGKPGVAASLPVLNSEGVNVAGRLRVADIALDVPVAALGSDVQLTPSLVDGREGELVVRGCAYQGAIERITDVPHGSSVTFTQMDGVVRRYVAADAGELRGEFNDYFDLLVYYQDAFGTKHWLGCVEAP